VDIINLALSSKFRLKKEISQLERRRRLKSPPVETVMLRNFRSLASIGSRTLTSYGGTCNATSVNYLPFCQNFAVHFSTKKELPIATKLRNIDEVVKEIDTTLTPEQKEYADMLRKQIRGGPKSERCEFSGQWSL
jgi:hypothetical protein